MLLVLCTPDKRKHPFQYQFRWQFSKIVRDFDQILIGIVEIHKQDRSRCILSPYHPLGYFHVGSIKFVESGKIHPLQRLAFGIGHRGHFFENSGLNTIR